MRLGHARISEDLNPMQAALAPVGWAVSPTPVPYPAALATMQKRAAAIAAGEARELVWLLEHPPIYTAGTSASDDELLSPDRFPVFKTGRGGRLTYHGPGQRIAYVMLDLKPRGADVRAFVAQLERWVIDTLADLGVTGEVRPGRVGVWVPRPDRGPGIEDKIAAIGLRVSRWVSLHGISLNVAPDLSHYAGIVPCGIADQGVTSLADLGLTDSMEGVDNVLRRHFHRCFGPTSDASAPDFDDEQATLAGLPPERESPAP
jgi:lipoyl(octanoyl) transferase